MSTLTEKTNAWNRYFGVICTCSISHQRSLPLAKTCSAGANQFARPLFWKRKKTLLTKGSSSRPSGEGAAVEDMDLSFRKLLPLESTKIPHWSFRDVLASKEKRKERSPGPAIPNLPRSRFHEKQALLSTTSQYFSGIS